MLEFNSYDPQDKKRMADTLRGITDSATVYMCIGTEKVFSDSLGPRVGTLLNENMLYPAFVYGLSEQNITAENLLYCYSFIRAMHPDSKIVVIDAAVGSAEQIGKIQVSDNGIMPGAATNKNLPSVGDFSIIGIVADRSMSDFYTLNSEKDKLVGQVARFIVEAILVAIKTAA